MNVSSFTGLIIHSETSKYQLFAFALADQGSDLVSVETCYLIDIAMLVTFVLSAASGLVLWLALPNGYGGSGVLQPRDFPTIARHVWEVIHTYSILILTMLISIRFAINLRWIIQVTRKILGLN